MVFMMIMIFVFLKHQLYSVVIPTPHDGGKDGGLVGDLTTYCPPRGGASAIWGVVNPHLSPTIAPGGVGGANNW